MRIVIAPDKFKGSLPATEVAAAGGGAGGGGGAALGAGARRIVLGIGGSASTDGGAGLLQALGARVLDARGEPAGRGLGGGALGGGALGGGDLGGGDLRGVASLGLAGLAPALRSAEIILAADGGSPVACT